MKVKNGFREEYDEVVLNYLKGGPEGTDIVRYSDEVSTYLDATLQEYWSSESGLFLLATVSNTSEVVKQANYTLLRTHWTTWLESTMSRISMSTLCQVLYLVTSYWEHGDRLSNSLPPESLILLRDTIMGKASDLQALAEKLGVEIS